MTDIQNPQAGAPTAAEPLAGDQDADQIDGIVVTPDELAELGERIVAAEARADAAESAVEKAASGSTKAPVFAVWDATYLKFLPGTYDDRTAAAKAAKAAGADKGQDTGRLSVKEV